MNAQNAQIDFIGNGSVQGDLAGKLQANSFNINNMRPWLGRDGNAYVTTYKGGDPKDPKSYSAVQVNGRLQTNATVLRRDEWKRLDEAVLRISEERLGGVQDLIEAGLTYDIGDGMGSTVLEYHDMSDALDAELTMDGITRAQNDRPEYTTNYLPLPIIHADYELNARVLAVSRNLGQPLDTSLAEHAARKVNLKLENMLFTDTTYSYGGGTIYGYLNEPNINSVTLSTYGNWDDSGTSSTDIRDCVLAMKQASINSYHYGPWRLYIPTAYETVLDNDYDTSGTSTQTIRQRLMSIEGIQSIRVVDRLPADTVVLVQMTSDVVRLVRGMGIQNVEWQTEGGMKTNYKVMTIQVPQVRSDQDGNSGIVVAS